MTLGHVLERHPIATSITGAHAWRIRYVSTDYQGNATESSGLVIAPTTDAGNRPVMTWLHGTTGLGDAACPSAQPDPVRELTVYFSPQSTRSIDYGIPGLQSFIDAGWIVCATDYQGLGTEGMHHYTVNRTNALDGLCIAHAAQSMDLGAGKQVGAMGWSQGAAAAAAIAELDPEHYGDLMLIGTVPMSPGLIPLAVPQLIAGAMTATAGPPDSHLVMLLAGAAAAHPELTLADVFTPLGISIIEQAWNIQPVHHLNDTIGRLFHLEGAILDPQADRLPAWQAAIAAGSAMQRKPICPVFVCVDTFDGGTVVKVPWQETYISSVQSMGATISSREYPDADHFRLPTMCVADALAWMKPLFTNE